MPGTKRKHTDYQINADTGAENVHPSRKQKLDDGAENAELRKVFNDLREEIGTVQLEATRSLLRILSSKSSNQAQNRDYSITRLTKGLCSSAKAARQGFSIALPEVLRLAFKSDLKIVAIVDKIINLTTPDNKSSGDERRNYLIGRQYALQAVLRSGILEKASGDEAKYVWNAVADLAEDKAWLRSECGHMLCEFLKSKHGPRLSNDSVRSLIDSWSAKSIIKSPEGIALWLTVRESFPDLKLPKGVWHHNNPLASQERATVSKILLKNAIDEETQINGPHKKKASGNRQVTPSFAWSVILKSLYDEDGGSKFGAFWEECVAQQMFSPSSSTERKSLGLQIFTQALEFAPVSILEQVINANIMRCVLDQRAKSDRYLHSAAKLPLDQMVKRAKAEPAASSALLCKLLKVLPFSMDKVTKTTLESILASAEAEQLRDITTTAIDFIRSPGVDDPGDADKRRRVLADFLLSAIRSHRSEPAQLFSKGNDTTLVDWLQLLLRNLAHLGYTTSTEKCSPPIQDASRAVFRERLVSALGLLVDLPLHQAVAAPSAVVETLHESKKSLTDDLDEKSAGVLRDARKQIKDAVKKAKSATGTTLTVIQAFQLLLSLAMLQVYKQEPDSAEVLADIISCYQMPKEDGDSSTMIVELLLSFISKPSKLFRKLTEQVFSAFAPEVTPEGLQSMVDILSQKESLAGQQELFRDNDEEGEENENEDDEEEAVDVEDDSDVEIVNGEVINGGEEDSEDITSDEDDSSAEDDDDDDDDDDVEEDEEAAFDRKLADALGTAGMEASNSDSDSDMDDDQMMALEPHLTNIFKERKKTTSKKQDNASAKENIINFKNRVLDLLSIYVKTQCSNILTLDLLHPLITLTRTTSSPPTAQKAATVLETLFNAAKKHETPTLPTTEAGFELLKAIHEEMKLGGSKVHASACSKSSLFLAKLLVGMDADNWREIADMYTGMQDVLRRDPKSKIHRSVLNDWHNWCMSTL